MAGIISTNWLFYSMAAGIFGILIILLICIHIIHNFFTNAIGTKLSRSLYYIFLSLSWISCAAFAFFRSDLIFPMNTHGACKFGYSLSTEAFYLTKIALFTIFLYRIDLAFYSSALAYPRKFLITVLIIYILIITTLNNYFLYIIYDLIHAHVMYYNNDESTLLYCTSGGVDSTKDKAKRRVFAAMALMDIVFSIFVCTLFVYKLRVVVQMGREQNARSPSARASGQADEHDMKLQRVIRKQTALVITACLTSLMVLGLNAVVPGFAMMVPIDIIINVLCVWLMFTFTDKIWKKTVKYIFCCCYCYIFKEDVMVTMNSLSKSVTSKEQNKIEIKMREYTRTRTDSNAPQPPILIPPISANPTKETQETPETKETKETHHIQIIFDNSKDIKLDKNKELENQQNESNGTTIVYNDANVEERDVVDNDCEINTEIQTQNEPPLIKND